MGIHLLQLICLWVTTLLLLPELYAFQEMMVIIECEVISWKLFIASFAFKYCFVRVEPVIYCLGKKPNTQWTDCEGMNTQYFSRKLTNLLSFQCEIWLNFKGHLDDLQLAGRCKRTYTTYTTYIYSLFSWVFCLTHGSQIDPQLNLQMRIITGVIVTGSF